ncbi:MAG: UDP-N-acetylmuramoyl-tripeptide--D-alanyl-D-alanine ligase [Bacteroidetes bacterium]|nr:UDP-N-acetylmuramoyl-tripeptide--D-alanyl-D-alanine ligase [Bacteroidota bacterium]MBU1373898.1 UDP-N-acetylmuramoyl-tripeptide--D-alanyl-D-alanine ligase [Bacteroidota bacterium]MBU1485503.1 UDP-N-acetylmuramoyl-tripeptide--D-alanyl-D-alanine ligase [Bacteroidota bacterium]MBU1759372.1 UDP-N-acetylmuramoyl-tripeptide--D-alanyl-D-alanine ligase [Bacteroidota bacterium]MBU2268415.1 UDP-N-acetylmuramoyl-tripeptide--D-alanyl-D-alanine ligase [Bacteroidota bacterium]
MSILEIYSIYLQHPQICTDTRKITDGCLFFALKGENFDANNFAEQALEKGAAYVVIDNPEFKKSEQCILVDDTLLTLQELAKHHRQQLKIPFIGLTGSNGKTTTKELINSVLSQKFKASATKGNLNNHIGVPLTLLEINNDVEIAIIEMGANHQKEIEMLSGLCQPNYGLITNVGKAHLEGFGGFEGVKKGKGELYDFLVTHNGTVFINKDNTHLMEMAATRNFKEVISYGASSSCDVSGELISNHPFLEVKWTSNHESYQVVSHLTGTYNFENILVAVAIGLRFGLSPKEINTGICNYAPQNNRSQIIKTANNTVIGDYYNANPSSMAVALENMAALTAEKKVVLLGDMFELGDESAEEHQSIINKAMSYDFDEIIFIGEMFTKLSSSAKAKFFKNRDEAIEYLKKNPIQNSLVLLKGSRGMKLEGLMELL